MLIKRLAINRPLKKFRGLGKWFSDNVFAMQALRWKTGVTMAHLKDGHGSLSASQHYGSRDRDKLAGKTN